MQNETLHWTPDQVQSLGKRAVETIVKMISVAKEDLYIGRVKRFRFFGKKAIETTVKMISVTKMELCIGSVNR